MTSPIGGLIQTIFKLKELQQRDEAAQLAKEQFGLEQFRVGLTQGQMAEQGITLAQDIAKNSTDPTQFLQHVPFLARVSGASPDVLNTVFQNTPPTTETTRGSQVASGVQSAGGTLARPAAIAALTGGDEGALARSGLDASVVEGAKTLLGQMDPAAKASLEREVLFRTAAGMNTQQAALVAAFNALPQDKKNKALEIGIGLAPDANTEVQGALGLKRLALDTSVAGYQQQEGSLRMDILRAELDAKLKGKDPERHAKIAQLLNNYDQALQDWQRSSGTLNAAGQVLKAQSVNAIAAELMQLGPDIFVDAQGHPTILPIKPGENMAETNPFLRYIKK